ncbi:MAG: 50S ribosomal protein L15 [Alphaproteobacteria bacterium RIFCSPHIGHO2_01_FULL_41_14]|nr:MAG: 50S ribosomal protein L15 [Alphaproteobacteria bacterium GWB1_45_5]OFW76029.1 MAG: 50S ribosomal protein L15 [Alphaproteobacteria bacterium GWA1_45_9]OFW90070.1 MAG: 50S ribosomal protein L15 [Alphaproteobacteria bacterium RIFCSPHIGHO2_01_FULL_41_14]HCI48553.1 50S ribosomal protein L15 [Holosporales bacterium]
MKLNTIRDNRGATSARKRVGRGIGSGLGKTCGHGQKGQKARSGVAIKGFEGGQMPIQLRVPKRGFKRAFVRGPEGSLVNLGSIQDAIDAKKLDAAAVITKENLVSAGLIRSVAGTLKLLAKGDLTAKITIEVDQASKSAQVFVEKRGGQVKLPTIQA